MSRGRVRFQGNSLPEGFYQTVKEAPDQALFATKRNGKWEDLLAKDALKFVLHTMAGLERTGFSTSDRICIFSENREEWILTDYAAQWLRGSTTAIYSTSSKETIDQILESAKPKVIFVENQDMLDKLGNISKFDFIKAVVAWESMPNEQANLGSIPLIQREEFLEDNIEEDVAAGKLKAIQPDDLSILLYTSGTTGEPKGVMLSQYNIVTNVRQMHMAIPIYGLKRTMSFLPLCHIYERSLHTTLLFAGVKVHFAESIDQLVQNVQEVKPDIMIGVPRVFEKMYVKIHEKLKEAPAARQLFAKLGFALGAQTVSYRREQKPLPLYLELPYKLFDATVFKTIRSITGGELKYFVSGGAPLSKDIAEFFFQAGITILEGYGLSETSILCVNRPGNIKFGTVGLAFDETEFRIAEDGEILVRGPQIMKAYFNLPEKTKESFTEDGWFKTGDIGEIDDEGYIRITDRKKEIIVTAAGKNVAPQPIENSLKAEPLIEQVCVCGDRRKYLVALIVPNLELCQKWCQENGQPVPSTLADCAQNEGLKKYIEEILARVNEGLGRYATLKYFHLLSEPFTIESGEITPTMKLKRRIINDKYAKEIDELYPEEDRIAS